MLRKAGFIELPGKGSHTNWIHPFYAGKITIAGKDGGGAKRYQERAVQQAIIEVEENEQDEQT